jgi:transcriptional regulator with XRE-family HTH domain
MAENFGARLRHQREKKGISLKAIAQQTKIKLSLLEGLEKDDIRHWPEGIFRRAYVREYAHAIGLDPDVVVREFVERYPAPIEVPDPPPPTPTRLRSLVDSALGSIRPAFAATSGQAPAAIDPQSAAGGRASAAARDTVPDAGASVDLRQPDLLAAARICTQLGRVEHSRQIPPLLREAAGILDAKGLIVWVWDALTEELKPAVALGYPAQVLSQLRGLKRDADNATAAAFRSGDTRVVTGALVVPLLTPAACAGVLAIELPGGAEAVPSVRAIATFFAAALAQLVGVTERA